MSVSDLQVGPTTRRIRPPTHLVSSPINQPRPFTMAAKEDAIVGQIKEALINKKANAWYVCALGSVFSLRKRNSFALPLWAHEVFGCHGPHSCCMPVAAMSRHSLPCSRYHQKQTCANLESRATVVFSVVRWAFVQKVATSLHLCSCTKLRGSPRGACGCRVHGPVSSTVAAAAPTAGYAFSTVRGALQQTIIRGLIFKCSFVLLLRCPAAHRSPMAIRLAWHASGTFDKVCDVAP